MDHGRMRVIGVLGFVSLRLLGLVFLIFPLVYMMWVIGPIFADERPPDVFADRPAGIAIAGGFLLAALAFLIPGLAERFVAYRARYGALRLLYRLSLAALITAGCLIKIPLFDPQAEPVLLPGGGLAVVGVVAVWALAMLMVVVPGVYVWRLRAHATLVQTSLDEVFDHGGAGAAGQAAAREVQALALRSQRAMR